MRESLCFIRHNSQITEHIFRIFIFVLFLSDQYEYMTRNKDFTNVTKTIIKVGKREMKVNEGPRHIRKYL